MFKTIKRIATHISCVQKALFCVVHELRQRALVHDASKFNEDELKGYLRFEEMPEGLEYGSDAYKAAMAKIMKDNNCFELHSINNDHHPEHWDYPEGGSDVGLMGLFQIIEMVCDWAGAHLAYGNKSDWHQSVNHNTDRYKFSISQKWVIEQTASFLARKIPDLKDQE